MNGSAYYLQKYLHLKHSDKLEGVVRQIDKVVRLMALSLGADFTAVFVRRPDEARLIPVSYFHQTGSVKKVESLEASWESSLIKGGDKKGKLTFLSDSDSSDSSDAEFVAANGYRCSYNQAVVNQAGETQVLLMAYWKDSPEAVEENVESINESALDVLSGLLDLARSLRYDDDYARRLSDMIGILDAPIGEYRFSELISKIAEHGLTIEDVGGTCILARDKKDGRLKVGDIIHREAMPADLFFDKMVTEVSGIATEAKEDNGNELVTDLSISMEKFFPGVIALELSPEQDKRLVLVLWSSEQHGFTDEDKELINLFGYFARSILTNAMLIRRWRKSNQLLKKSTDKLVNLEALAALADMTSGLAHEFNNMIGGVVGRVQLLKRRIDDQKTLAGLSTIEAMVLESAETVQRIQEFVVSAKYKKLEAVDLCRVLRVAVGAGGSGRWQKLAQQKNVSVRPVVPIESATVRGFESDLHAALERLIENAVEASPDDDIVTVAIERRNNEFVVSVNDHGAGISEKARDKIFYPFYSTKGERGAGMGLAIVHGVIVRHQGKIEVDIEPGKGTSFVLSFESFDAGEDTTEITAKHKGKGKLNVLVVDDDEQIRDVLSDMLQMEGHKTQTCADGYAALEELEKADFDLLITDLGMPGLSGMDLAGMAHENRPEMPIAMITGWGTQLEPSEVKNRGILTVLAKPFHLKDVRSIIEGVLNY